MAQRRVVVAGASGFIGRNVLERLAKRDDLDLRGVHFSSPAPEIPGVSILKADLRVAADAARVLEGCDVLIQAAATTSGARDMVNRPFHHVTDNAVMNALLFRAAHELGVKHIVFFSCTTMYASSDRPLREEDFREDGVDDKYFGVAWTKMYAEKMSEFYSRLGKTRYSVLRHSNIYGPYDKFDLERSHVFGATLTKVVTCPDGGEITVWGSGEERRDLLYVSDLVDCVELALDKQRDPFLLANVGAGRTFSVNEIVGAIIEASGKKIGVKHDRTKPTIPVNTPIDISRIEKALGWTPKVDFREGIRRTLEWHRQNVNVTP